MGIEDGDLINRRIGWENIHGLCSIWWKPHPCSAALCPSLQLGFEPLEHEY